MSLLDEILPRSPEAEVHAAIDFLWPENVKHVSASSLKTFAACPEQYRRRYLLGDKQPPAAATLWGRADHDAAELNYRQKIESGTDLPVADVQNRFASTLDEAVESSGGIRELEFPAKVKGLNAKKKDLASTKDRGVLGVTRYHEDVAPSVQPVVVEHEFRLELPGVPVPILGYIDLEAVPHESVRPGALTMIRESTLADAGTVIFGEEETEVAVGDESPIAKVVDANNPWLMRRLIERKTSGAKKAKPEPDWSFQGALYQLARWLPIEYQLTVKTQNPYVQAGERELLIKASPTRKRWAEKAVRSLVLELGWCYVTFGADEPWPATRALFHQWRCGYCGYSGTCSWRKG